MLKTVETLDLNQVDPSTTEETHSLFVLPNAFLSIRCIHLGRKKDIFLDGRYLHHITAEGVINLSGANRRINDPPSTIKK